MLQSFEIGTGWIWIENYKYSKGHLKSCNSCNFQSNRWRLVVSNAASRFVCREPNMRFVTPNAVEQHRGTKVLSRPHWEWDHWCENNVPEKSHARAIQTVSSNAKHRHRQQSQTLTVLPTPHFMERNRTTLLLVISPQELVVTSSLRSSRVWNCNDSYGWWGCCHTVHWWICLEQFKCLGIGVKWWSTLKAHGKNPKSHGYPLRGTPNLALFPHLG